MAGIPDLPDGRWMATSCPVSNLRMDRSFLDALGGGAHGRILSNQVKDAVRWLTVMLEPSASWTACRPYLPIGMLREDHPEAAALKRLAMETAAGAAAGPEAPGAPPSAAAPSQQDAPGGPAITLEAVRAEIARLTTSTGETDGFISPEAIEDEGTARFAADLLKAYGKEGPDGLDSRGIGEAHILRFQQEVPLLLAWHRRASGDPAVLPFGEDTARLHGLLSAIRAKVEHYFAVCRLVAYDRSYAEAARSWIGRRLQETDPAKMDGVAGLLADLPLSPPAPDGLLHLDDIRNPLYTATVADMRKLVLPAVLGDGAAAGTLSEEQWRIMGERFAPYEAWVAEKPEVAIGFLSEEKLEAYLAAAHNRIIEEMIRREKRHLEKLGRLRTLEKLLLFHQWLFLFVNNFVSFPNLFRTDARAIFEMGSLVMEGREFCFSIRVDDVESHAALAKNSEIYLLYVQVSGPGPEDQFRIAVPVTSGNARGFYVGKRGVFFAWDGRELDARVVKIVDNPISLWESMRQPFRRLAGMITSRFSQKTAALEKGAEASILSDGASAPQPSPATQEVQAAAVQGATTRGSRDLMVGAGLLVAGLGTAVKFLVDAAKQLTQPETLRVLLAMIGLFLLVSVGVNAITAARRLRRRNLSVLLQASGWAVNGKMRLIPSMARLFTRRTTLPPGSRKRRFRKTPRKAACR